jgi:hypothetical protein
MIREEIGKCHLCGGEVIVKKHDPPLRFEDGWLLDTYECNVCNVDQEHIIRYKKDLED